jgi:hypothetical protein
VARLESLQAFNMLVAPFDGVVTSRGIDVGHLVTAGGNAGKPLFTVSDTHRMRVYVSVPQAFLGELKAGLKASLALPQYPGRTFEAELVTTSNSVATDSRAALVELHADELGRNLGSEVEILSGISPEDSVIDSPPESLTTGQLVSVVERPDQRQAYSKRAAPPRRACPPIETQR